MMNKIIDHLEPGEGLARLGDYALLKKLAHGGMAEIFLARHVDDGPDGPLVVIKRILPELARDPQFVALFVNEAQLVAQMKHPSIVAVTDFGEADGHLFMVMEYVEGLDCWRFSRRLYPWGEHHEALAVQIVAELMSALDYVHEFRDVNGHPMRIVHRDVSPSNIYLSFNGDVKLGDFGIARVHGRSFRRTALIPKGKFGYMAPEQVEGLGSDRRVDIFAAGVVLAELVLGQRIFSGHSHLSVMLEIRDGRLEVIEQNTARISPSLLPILRQALSRDPKTRWPNAAAMREALLGFLASAGHRPPAGELARQVARALSLQDRTSVPPGSAQEPTPATPESVPRRPSMTPVTAPRQSGRPSSSAIMTPAVGGLSSTPVVRRLLTPASVEADGTPITMESQTLVSGQVYTVALATGPTKMTYAAVVEAICSDVISGDTPISEDGNRFLAVAEIAELARHLPQVTPTREVEGVEAPDRRGLFEVESPSEVVLTLILRRETGLLVAQSGRRRKEIYYKAGQVVYVSSNAKDELLGEFLVGSGVLERTELELALNLLPKFNGHLGDTLIALGMLSAVELFNQICTQVRARFQEMLGWLDGTYEFYRGVKPRADLLEAPFDAAKIVTDHLVRESARVARVEVVEELSGLIVAPGAHAAELLSMCELPQDLQDTAAALREPKNLKQWIGEVKDRRAKRALVRGSYVAIEAGLWRVEEGQPPWRKLVAPADGTSGGGPV